MSSGLFHPGLDSPPGYIASTGLPTTSALAVIVSLLELFGGLALMVGFHACWAALALGLFTLAASLLFCKFWAMPADKASMRDAVLATRTCSRISRGDVGAGTMRPHHVPANPL